MRYFVYHRPDTKAVRPYILAEVMRENGDDGTAREWSAAASLAGERCDILTREELALTADGSRALRAWGVLDDRQFDIDTVRMAEAMAAEEADAEGRPHLRLVPDPPEPAPEFVGSNARLQWLASRRRTLLIESARLQESARALVQQGIDRRIGPPPVLLTVVDDG